MAAVPWTKRRETAEAFAPVHFNYAFLQNQDRHVHLHVIPRYAKPRDVAGVRSTDSAYPDHYELGQEKVLGEPALREIANALAGYG